MLSLPPVADMMERKRLVLHKCSLGPKPATFLNVLQTWEQGLCISLQKSTVILTIAIVTRIATVD